MTKQKELSPSDNKNPANPPPSPPSGEKNSVADPVPPPPADPLPSGEKELAIVAFVQLVLKHKWKILAGIFLLGLVALFDAINWVDYRVLSTLLFFIGGALAYLRAKGKKEAWTTFRKHKKKLVLLLLVGPLVSPFVCKYYGGAFTADWDRIADPPKMYYIYRVNPGYFREQDKELLQQIDPGHEQGESMKGLILASARMAGIEADKLVPFEPSALSRGEKFALILFEGINTREEIGEGDSAKTQKKGRLLVYFITPKPPPEPASTQASAGEISGSKPPLFTIKMVEAQDLQVTFGLLWKGFSDSTGVKNEMDALEQILNPPPPIVDGPPVLDGPG